MSIYDNLIFTETLSTEVPFNITESKDEEYRLWQTKDLNASMDLYGLLPIADLYPSANNPDRVLLCRRHPPIFKWTTQNLGIIEQNSDFKALISSADHWRSIRYTGSIDASLLYQGTLYTLTVKLENGIVDEITKSGSTEINFKKTTK
jgi:hypothetical protein